MIIRKCSLLDIDKLAELNKQLIEDEKSDNRMNLSELKTDTLDIEVLSWNEPGIRFWTSCGFVERSKYMRLDKNGNGEIL